MKKRAPYISLLISLIVILTILPTILAVTIDLSKESYQPGELLQAEITGNFISFDFENILIYEGDKVHSTPTISDLTRQGSIYYYYSILPATEGNYSIRIENAEYIEVGQTKEDTIIKNLTIERSNTSALSINPGFILTSEDFTIKIKSLYDNVDTTAKLDATGETKTLSLLDSLEKTISFSVEGITEPTTLSIQDYDIPVFIIGKNTTKPKPPVDKKELTFLPEAMTGKVTKAYAFKVLLENSGTLDITNIEISTDSEAVLGTTKIDKLEPEEQVEIPVIIPEDLERGEEFSGIIIASFDQEKITLPFTFEITTNQREIEIVPDIKSNLSCADLNGKKCEDNEECTTQQESSTDGPCCTGTCKKIKEPNTRLITGILVLIIVVIIVTFIYYKAKTKLKPKSTQEILKEKKEKYGERMQRPEHKEISGGLGKT